jgi:MYXO-CTERM domain-containing protein
VGQTVCARLCGDGVVLADEECDDGNLAREDGCSHCQVEVGWLCDDGEPTECSQLPDDGGCSCRAGGDGGGFWLLILLLPLLRRRRAA